MTAIIIIIVIAIIFYFFFLNKKTETNDIVIEKDSGGENLNEHAEIGEQEQEYHTDENGNLYKLAEKSREIPRRTYIKATLNGKFWGEFDEAFSNQFEHSNFFDFNIYEVTLKDAVYNTLEPFHLDQDFKIPREKLPKLLHTILEKDGKEYEVNLHEPTFEQIKFKRKLHQNEGNEVFGTIDAVVAGYILDFTKTTYFEKEYIVQDDKPIIGEPQLEKSFTATGNVEYFENYKRTEYFYSDNKKTYWSDWEYTQFSTATNNEGCFSTLIGLIATIVGIAFLLMILPQIAFLLPFFLILFLLNLIPTKFSSLLFRVIGLMLLIGFIVSLIQFFNNSASTYIPKPVVAEKPEEQQTQTEQIIDTVDNIAVNDTRIAHFRVWQDYEGNKYEGIIFTMKSDFIEAKNYKKNLELRQNTEQAYDDIVYLLKENDKNNLSGVYQLFDSIQQEKQLSSIKFAELIVSFVQDIPYAVIVPDDCNPNSYDDKFIQEYLSSENARCDGFEKFGINSPVEFMSNLNGDCDTRTLLLYTILSHYGYEVALFSSEYYRHSILGINLPINGTAFQYQNQRYVLWETTAPNIKPGILPKEISNLNYWRISLKSK